MNFSHGKIFPKVNHFKSAKYKVDDTFAEVENFTFMNLNSLQALVCPKKQIPVGLLVLLVQFW